MNWTDFDNYVRPEHLHGKPARAKIAEVKIEKFYSKGRSFEKPVLYFENARRGLPLNATNRRSLMQIFGDDAGACIGQVITLEPVSENGQETLRIRGAQ